MRRYWLQWLTLAMLAVMLVTLTGCRSVKYIPVTEYRDRYVSKTDSFIKTDSVYLHDSVSVFAKGDTVYIAKIHFKDRFKIIYHTKTDTVAVHDSIPYPVNVEVEKRQSAIDKVFTWLGKMAGILLVVFTVLIVYNLARKH